MNSIRWHEWMNGWRERERDTVVPLVQLDRWALVLLCPQETPCQNRRRETLLLQYMMVLFNLSWVTWLIGWAWFHVLNQLIAALFTKSGPKWPVNALMYYGSSFLQITEGSLHKSDTDRGRAFLACIDRLIENWCKDSDGLLVSW